MMRTAKALLLLGLGLMIPACGMLGNSSRNAPFEVIPDAPVEPPADTAVTPLVVQDAPLVETALAPASGPVAETVPAPASDPVAQALVSVNAIHVRVPRSLKVSEANRYLPRGDIVWRGDPIGDRYVQVQQIFQDAALHGVSDMEGPAKVDIDIEVSRFHALTEKARYTTGGVHAITFDLSVKHPETGALLVPVRTVRADLDAFGGKQAIAADARGETQKVRITNHLARVIRKELTDPQGYQNASLGFYQLLNNM